MQSPEKSHSVPVNLIFKQTRMHTQLSAPIDVSSLHKSIENSFPKLSKSHFTIYYIDEEGDEVRITCNSDLAEALRINNVTSPKYAPKFYIKEDSQQIIDESSESSDAESLSDISSAVPESPQQPRSLPSSVQQHRLLADDKPEYLDEFELIQSNPPSPIVPRRELKSETESKAVSELGAAIGSPQKRNISIRRSLVDISPEPLDPIPHQPVIDSLIDAPLSDLSSDLIPSLNKIHQYMSNNQLILGEISTSIHTLSRRIDSQPPLPVPIVPSGVDTDAIVARTVRSVLQSEAFKDYIDQIVEERVAAIVAEKLEAQEEHINRIINQKMADQKSHLEERFRQLQVDYIDQAIEDKFEIHSELVSQRLVSQQRAIDRLSSAEKKKKLQQPKAPLPEKTSEIQPPKNCAIGEIFQFAAPLKSDLVHAAQSPQNVEISKPFVHRVNLRNTGEVQWINAALVWDGTSHSFGFNRAEVGAVDVGERIDIPLSLVAPAECGYKQTVLYIEHTESSTKKVCRVPVPIKIEVNVIPAIEEFYNDRREAEINDVPNGVSQGPEESLEGESQLSDEMKAKIKHLVEMGFNELNASRTLASRGGNLEESVADLLG